MEANPTPKKPLLVKLRENLLLGLLALAPLAVTLWILTSIIGTLDSAVYRLIPDPILPRSLFGFNIPGLGIVITFLLLLGAGAAARTVFGKLFENLSDGFFSRIPFVGGLYKTARQVSNVFFSNESAAAFKKVVYVPFPSAPAKALAFVTGHPSPGYTTVFVPTAPNPTGGYVLIYPDSHVEDAHVAVDEALKTILSCGAVSSSSQQTPHAFNSKLT